MSEPLRILIVEDQAILAMELEQVLAEAGHEVIGCAIDAAGAATLAASRAPDLALVDVNLRDGVTGPSIAAHLIQTYGAVVVFVTANPEQIPEGFSGAIGAVVKPFDDQTILAVAEFAARFRRERAVDHPPGRLRLAPWLRDPPPNLPRH